MNHNQRNLRQAAMAEFLQSLDALESTFSAPLNEERSSIRKVADSSARPDPADAQSDCDADASHLLKTDTTLSALDEVEADLNRYIQGHPTPSKDSLSQDDSKDGL